MNRVILMGRLTKEPQIKYGEGNEPLCVARFTLAVDRRFKKAGDSQTADFISCVAFGKTGEFIERYGKQGTKFVLEGRIQTGSYTNRDGNRVYTTDVVVEGVEFAEKKSSSENSNNNNWQQSDNGVQMTPDGFMNIPDGVEDVPFA